MTELIDRYAVFGNPIEHSKSPQIHTLFAQQTEQHMVYVAELVVPDHFDEAVEEFIAHNGKGLNITVPFKEDAWARANHRSDRAQRAGAVNTLKLLDDGSLYGDTTDGVGLVRDLVQNHEISLKDKNLLLVGAGGAVRGVLESLLAQQPASLLITNRTRVKAENLAADFVDLGPVEGCGLDDVQGNFDIIINGTSASLQGDLPALPASIFKPGCTSYDMMYAAQATPFMQWSEENGADAVFDGLGMLVEQAAESFYIWRGVMPETRMVIKAIRAALLKG